MSLRLDMPPDAVASYFIAQHAETSGGPAGWRVINYFLGALTIFDGILLLVFHARVVSNATGGGEQHPWKWEQVRECFRDPQYWFAIRE
jgi:ACS family allantoate permease-like MFS transporter